MDLTARSWVSDLLILTVLTTLLFGVLLGSRPLEVPDGARYAEIPREMVATGDYVTPRLNGLKYFEKPAFFYWLQSIAIKFFGMSEWSLRLVNLLMAVGGCLLTYVGARKCYGRRSGLLASIVLATSVIYYVLGHIITLDMTVSVLLTGTLLSFMLGAREPPGRTRKRYMWSMYVFAALATLTKGLIGIVLPGMIIFAWLCFVNDWRSLKTYCLLSGTAIFLLIAAPWHILLQIKHPEFFHFYFIEQHLARFFTNYAHRAQAIWFLPMFLVLGIFPWTGFLPPAIYHSFPKPWRTRFDHKEGLFLLLWPACIFIFFWISHSQLVPYILPMFPPMAILMGRYLASVWEKKSTFSLWMGFSIATVLALILAAAGFFITTIRHLPNVAQVSFYLRLSGAIAVVGTVSAIIAFWRRGLKLAFPILAVSAGIFFISMNISVPPIDQRSVKPLALALKPLLTRDDEVITYRNYYQDLPVYLQRRITVVDWHNELTFGIEHQDAHQWMIQDKAFWKRWDSDKRVFVVATNGDYRQMRDSHPDDDYYLIAKTATNVLITNQPRDDHDNEQ